MSEEIKVQSSRGENYAIASHLKFIEGTTGQNFFPNFIA